MDREGMRNRREERDDANDEADSTLMGSRLKKTMG